MVWYVIIVFSYVVLIESFQTQHDFLHEWKYQHRHQYLTELLRLEAAPDNRNCVSCNDVAGLYRCIDCGLAQPLFCEECCLKTHKTSPFHWIQRWTGNFFAAGSLDDLGLVIHMGHDGTPCPLYDTYRSAPDCADIPTHQGMDEPNGLLLGTSWSSHKQHPQAQYLLCVDVTGVHRRQVKWCLCPNAPEHHVQLFRMHLFSASHQRPSTAFTFNVLDLFYVEAMECKTSAFNFFNKLQRLTNNAFPSLVPVSHRLLGRTY
jgi:hypothetical protein